MDAIKELGGYLILLAAVATMVIILIHKHVSSPEPKKLETCAFLSTAWQARPPYNPDGKRAPRP